MTKHILLSLVKYKPWQQRMQLSLGVHGYLVCLSGHKHVKVCGVCVRQGFGNGGGNYWCGSEKLPQLQVRPTPDQGRAHQCLCNNILKRGKKQKSVGWLLLFWEFFCFGEEWERDKHVSRATQINEEEGAGEAWSSQSPSTCGEMAGWALPAPRDQW